MCQFLAVVEGANYLGNNMGHDRQGAVNDVRNNTAALGGNAFLIVQDHQDPIGTVIQAEAYICPDSRQQGEPPAAKIQTL